MVVVLGSDMMPEKTVNQRSHKRTQLRAYTYRNTPTGANGIQPKPIENMIMTSFRYYLP
jgi:hypothetical protein